MKLASNHLKNVIVRLDRTIQHLFERMDSPIKSGNDKTAEFLIFNCRISKQRSFQLVWNLSSVSYCHSGLDPESRASRC